MLLLLFWMFSLASFVAIDRVLLHNSSVSEGNLALRILDLFISISGGSDSYLFLLF